MHVVTDETIQVRKWDYGWSYTMTSEVIWETTLGVKWNQAGYKKDYSGLRLWPRQGIPVTTLYTSIEYVLVISRVYRKRSFVYLVMSMVSTCELQIDELHLFYCCQQILLSSLSILLSNSACHSGIPPYPSCCLHPASTQMLSVSEVWTQQVTLQETADLCMMWWDRTWWHRMSEGKRLRQPRCRR